MTKEMKLRNPHIIGLSKMTGIEEYGALKKAINKLRRLEIKAHTLAEHFANGNTAESIYDRAQSDILTEVKAICKNAYHIFVNNDPRGYAIKTSQDTAEEFGIEQDWGKYGIIAPDGLYIYNSKSVA